MIHKRRALTVVGFATILVAGACGGGTSTNTAAGANGSPVKVGLLYPKTGLLAGYGAQYRAGFDAGLAYATNGTGKVDGRRIQVAERDSAADPAKAVSAAKELIGSGFKILAGTASSGVAVQLAPIAAQNKVLYISGPAATDAITGVNEYTFRSGRETYQDVATAAQILGDVSGKSVLVFAQDYEFGQANVKAVQAVLGGAGAKVSSLLVPLTATDITPFAQQVKQRKPDLLFVAWAGDTTKAMWTSLDQQGVFAATKVVTGLADQASFTAYGPAASKITFLSYYFPGAPSNPVNDALRAKVSTPDLFTPDGFVAAQMVVRAVQRGGDDVQKMISALEGWTFQAPKGSETVRAADHAMIQPMYVARLTGSGTSLQPTLVRTVPAETVAPPVAATKG